MTAICTPHTARPAVRRTSPVVGPQRVTRAHRAPVTRAPSYEVVLPARLADPAPSSVVYIRRRLLAAVVSLAVVLGVWSGAGNVLANRGGDPASAAAARQAASYVVQPGDSLWSIAEAHHGAVALATYVDVLVARNGGSATIQPGQLLTLP